MSKGILFGAITKGVDNEGKFSAIANARTLDRHGEIMEPKGARLDAYRANPVLLACHQSWFESGAPPVIGKTIAIEPTDKALPFDGQFANAGLGPQYRELYAGGYMRAFSVGFRYGDSIGETIEGEAGPQYVRRVKTWELLEISAVAVPSNRESLIKAAQKGVGGNLVYGLISEAMLLASIGERAGLRDDEAAVTLSVEAVARFIAARSADADSVGGRVQQIELHSKGFAAAIEEALKGPLERIAGQLADIQDLLLSRPDERAILSGPDRAGSDGELTAEAAKKIRRELRGE